LKSESKLYKEIPEICKIEKGIIQRNYHQIKQEVQDIIDKDKELKRF
jgi:hypothetical protein